ncbi:sodium:calcium antiporter [Patescibacteria group bacterium]
MYSSILIIFITGLVIYFSGNKFVEASSKIGDYFKLSHSVKGATLDAIAGSFPELMIAIFSVVVFKSFDVAVGTITGSALFNLLIIPSIAVFISPKVFKISKEVIARDGMFYCMAVFAFLAALLYSTSWGVLIPVIFLIIYFWYVRVVVRHAKEYRNQEKIKSDKDKVSISKEFGIVFANMFLMGVASFFLTENAILLAGSLGIPAIVIAFTVVAATTSGPDAVISIVNARKGNVDDATSGIFGSNVFDILVGLSVPVLLTFWLTGEMVNVYFEQIEIIIGLLGATILVIYLMIEDFVLTKKEAVAMTLIYFGFLAYIVYSFVA